MANHTPGPWVAYPCRHSDNENEPPYVWQIRTQDRSDIVATTAQYGVHAGAPLGKEERGANARLIAAAPELLAALKDVKENAGNPERVYEITKAIIAKVEGVK